MPRSNIYNSSFNLYLKMNIPGFNALSCLGENIHSSYTRVNVPTSSNNNNHSIIIL
jgi:hypothetical protein